MVKQMVEDLRDGPGGMGSPNEETRSEREERLWEYRQLVQRHPLTIEEAPIDPATIPATDEAGNLTAPMPLADLVKVRNQTQVGANGVLTPRIVRETLKTGEQRVAEADKNAATLEATRALAQQRVTGKQYETQQLIEGYNTALDEGDEHTAALYKSLIDRKAAMPGILQDGTTFRRRMEQNAADAGVTLDQATELSKTPQGMAALTQLAIANKAAAKSPFGAPTLSADQRALINAAGTGAAAPAALPFQQRTEQILAPQTQAAVTVRTKAEYDVLPSGSLYVGPDGVTKRKK